MTNLCPQTGLKRDYAAEAAAYRRREIAIKLAAEGARRNEIERICARYQLESDEFETREQKAARYLR